MFTRVKKAVDFSDLEGKKKPTGNARKKQKTSALPGNNYGEKVAKVEKVFLSGETG